MTQDTVSEEKVPITTCSHPDCETTLGLTKTDLGLLCGIHLAWAKDICAGESRLIAAEGKIASLTAADRELEARLAEMGKPISDEEAHRGLKYTAGLEWLSRGTVNALLASRAGAKP